MARDNKRAGGMHGHANMGVPKLCWMPNPDDDLGQHIPDYKGRIPDNDLPIPDNDHLQNPEDGKPIPDYKR